MPSVHLIAGVVEQADTRGLKLLGVTRAGSIPAPSILIFLMHDELLDLVDEQDRVIGKMRRSEVYAKGLRNIRVVNAFVINSKDKLWIPRRTAHKRSYPLCLDMSMGGHVESGETYEETFRRELREELNLDADVVPCRFLGYLTPHTHDVHAFMKVWEIRQDESPHYNPDDFVEYFWLAPAALLQRLAEGDASKSDLPKLVKHFYGNHTALS